jgi:ABC-type dipeptide/oligopeptide/nickel transport system permease subunit
MMEFIQVFSAVAIGGIVGWVMGYCRGMKDERAEAIRWIRVVNERMDDDIAEKMQRAQR